MFTPRDFRDALSRYPTGVAIIACYERSRAHAITVNSFASVSLDPPLILWSIEKASERWRVFADAERFSVNVLAADQQALASYCAGSSDLAASGAVFETGPAPRLEGAVARFDCTRFAVHPGGDHEVILGRVNAMDALRDAPSLVFHRGEYGQAGGSS